MGQAGAGTRSPSGLVPAPRAPRGRPGAPEHGRERAQARAGTRSPGWGWYRHQEPLRPALEPQNMAGKEPRPGQEPLNPAEGDCGERKPSLSRASIVQEEEMDTGISIAVTRQQRGKHSIITGVSRADKGQLGM